MTAPVLSDTAENFDPDTERYTPGVSSHRDGASKFLHSGIKNMDAKSASNQTISATRDYDAFGNVIGSTGTWQGNFGYAGGYGYQEDSATGLKLLGHRYYDSTTGSFISKDPARSGRNWYGYCENNPLELSDPSGENPLIIPVIIIIIVASGGVAHGPAPGEDLAAAEKRGRANTNALAGDVATTIMPIGIGVKGASALLKLLGKAATKGGKAAAPAAKLTGQVHHWISRRIERALNEHAILSASSSRLRNT